MSVMQRELCGWDKCFHRKVAGDVHQYCTVHSSCFSGMVYDPRACDACNALYDASLLDRTDNRWNQRIKAMKLKLSRTRKEYTNENMIWHPEALKLYPRSTPLVVKKPKASRKNAGRPRILASSATLVDQKVLNNPKLPSPPASGGCLLVVAAQLSPAHLDLEMCRREGISPQCALRCRDDLACNAELPSTDSSMGVFRVVDSDLQKIMTLRLHKPRVEDQEEGLKTMWEEMWEQGGMNPSCVGGIKIEPGNGVVDTDISKSRSNTPRRVYCDWCNFSTTEHALMATHVRKHTGVARAAFRCCLCNYSTLSRTHYNEHLMDTHCSFTRAKFIDCKYCNYQSDTRGNMFRHLARHSGQRHGPGFGRPKMWTKKSKHDEDKPFKCSIKPPKSSLPPPRPLIPPLAPSPSRAPSCSPPLPTSPASSDPAPPSTSSNLSSLTSHSSVFSPVSSEGQVLVDEEGQNAAPVTDDVHRCEFCAYTTVSKGSLAQHTRVHTNPLARSCSACGYATVSESRFLEHLSMHKRAGTAAVF